MSRFMIKILKPCARFNINTQHDVVDRVCLPFCPLSGLFLGIWILVFSKFWHGVKNQFEVVHDKAGFFFKIVYFALKTGKMCPKLAKNRLFWIFWKIWSLIFSEFGLQWKFILVARLPHKAHIGKKYGSTDLGRNTHDQSDWRIIKSKYISRTNGRNSQIFSMLIQIQGS